MVKKVVLVTIMMLVISVFLVAIGTIIRGNIPWNFAGVIMAQEEPVQVIYLSDMSKCEPAFGLSEKPTKDKWRIISYETTDPNLKGGKMIGAASYVNAPEVRLPLGVSGWHAIYVGYWNPRYAYDGDTTIKFKLSDDPCFTRTRDRTISEDQNSTQLNETYFTTADLTGRDIVFGKVGGPFAEKAYIAYVRLVPLSAVQVVSLKADRARKDTRIMEAVIDGGSYMSQNEYRTKEHILEMVEPYRYSDVGKVIWAISYGGLTNYPSKYGSYGAGERVVPVKSLSAASPYTSYSKIIPESFRELASKGVIPQAVVAKHLHEMGLKFDIMLRLGLINYTLPPMDLGVPVKFLQAHPEYRMVLVDGTPVEKLSYAYPEVRQHILSIMREAAELFDVDGVNLAFVRTPQYVMCEKPVMDAFQKKYGQKAGKDFLLAVPKTKIQPKLDGVISKGEYDQAAKIDNFVGYITAVSGVMKTETFLSYDDVNLYLAFRAWDPDIDSANFVKQGMNQPDTYGGDIIELFIDPVADGANRYQICSNPVGIRYDESRDQGEKWQGDWKSVGSVAKESWVVEFAIPFTSLNVKAAPDGQFWSANFVRSGKVSDTWTGGWQNLGDYGKIFFGSEADMRAKRLVADQPTSTQNISFTDPRLTAVRCSFLTQFVREARQVLDEVGVKKGKKIELSAYVFSNTTNDLYYGLDVIAWLKEGLLDSIYCRQGEMDREMIAAAKANNCKFIWGDDIEGNQVAGYLAGYAAGVDRFAQWDADVGVGPEWWPVFRRAGHREEIQKDYEGIKLNNNMYHPQLKGAVELKTVGGVDVLEGLWHSAFSSD